MDDDGSDEKAESTSDLITYVMVHKMTVHDAHRLPDALDEFDARSLTPKVMLADSHDSCEDNMTLTKERNVDLAAPVRPTKGARAGRVTLEDFVLDEQGLIIRCPNDIAPVSISAAKVRLQARFDLSICRWRAGIDATMSQLKSQMNMANPRVRGMSAMRYVVHLRALGLNIHRCAAVRS